MSKRSSPSSSSNSTNIVKKQKEDHGTKKHIILPTRKLGKTGNEIPILGFPGAGLAVYKPSQQQEVNDLVQKAVENGATYYDMAPSYGKAMYRLGPALKPYRPKCFLACKTAMRDKEGVFRELEESLKALETNYFDLYQMHAMTTEDDFNQVMAPNGALEAFKEAKRKGLIKHIGFSAHDETIAVKLIETGEFETVMFPLNFLSFNIAGVGKRLIEAAAKHDVGIIAIKSLARARLPPADDNAPNPFANSNSRRKREFPIKFHKKWVTWYQPEDDMEKAEQLWRFTQSLPNLVSAISPGNMTIFFEYALKFAQKGDLGVTNPLVIDSEEGQQLFEYYNKLNLTPIFHEYDKSGKFVTTAQNKTPSSPSL